MSQIGILVSLSAGLFSFVSPASCRGADMRRTRHAAPASVLLVALVCPGLGGLGAPSKPSAGRIELFRPAVGAGT